MDRELSETRDFGLATRVAERTADPCFTTKQSGNGFGLAGTSAIGEKDGIVVQEFVVMGRSLTAVLAGLPLNEMFDHNLAVDFCQFIPKTINHTEYGAFVSYGNSLLRASFGPGSVVVARGVCRHRYRKKGRSRFLRLCRWNQRWRWCNERYELQLVIYLVMK